MAELLFVLGHESEEALSVQTFLDEAGLAWTYAVINLENPKRVTEGREADGWLDRETGKARSDVPQDVMLLCVCVSGPWGHPTFQPGFRDTFLEASLLGAILQWLAQNSELEDVSNPQALHAGSWWNSAIEDGVPGQIAFLESDGDPEDELDDYDALPEGVGRWCIFWGGKTSSWLELRREHVRDALFVLLDHMKWRLEEGDLPDDPETRQEAVLRMLRKVARKTGGLTEIQHEDIAHLFVRGGESVQLVEDEHGCLVVVALDGNVGWYAD